MRRAAKPIWQAELGAGASRSPAVADGIVAIGDNDGIVHGVDATTGEERWQFQTEGGGVTGTIAIAAGIAYFGTDDAEINHLYAVDVATGAQRWSFAAPAGADDAHPGHRRRRCLLRQ